VSRVSRQDFLAGPGSDVGFVLRNGASGDKHQIETMVSGVAVFDYGNDGWPDLYFVNGAAQSGLSEATTSQQGRLYVEVHCKSLRRRRIRLCATLS
jgi:hypothetical protein